MDTFRRTRGERLGPVHYFNTKICNIMELEHGPGAQAGLGGRGSRERGDVGAGRGFNRVLHGRTMNALWPAKILKIQQKDIQYVAKPSNSVYKQACDKADPAVKSTVFPQAAFR